MSLESQKEYKCGPKKKKVFKEVMVDNFLNLAKDINKPTDSRSSANPKQDKAKESHAQIHPT